jgi:ribose-phosphate pyrophosphokinase
VETLTAVPTLCAQLDCLLPRGAVVVAPDLGAVKLAERYAGVLQSQVAVVRKHRESGAAVTALDIAGDVRGRPAVIVDDMISTGATIGAAARLLRARGATSDITVAATHGLFVHAAASDLGKLGLRQVVVTDSVNAKHAATLISVCTIAPTLAAAIASLHSNTRLPQAST